MIFRRTIAAETRRDSTGAFPPLLFRSLALSLSLSLSPSVSLCLFTTTSLAPSLIISRFSPLPRYSVTFCPSPIHLSGCPLPSASNCSLLPRMPCLPFSFLLLPSCSPLSLSHHRKLFFLSSHDILPFLTISRSLSFLPIFPSLSLTQSVFLIDSRYPSLAHRSQRHRGQVVAYSPLLVHAHSTYCPLLPIPYPQLFDARGKDLPVAYFAKIDGSAIKQICQ